MSQRRKPGTYRLRDLVIEPGHGHSNAIPADALRGALAITLCNVGATKVALESSADDGLTWGPVTSGKTPASHKWPGKTIYAVVSPGRAITWAPIASTGLRIASDGLPGRCMVVVQYGDPDEVMARRRAHPPSSRRGVQVEVWDHPRPALFAVPARPMRRLAYARQIVRVDAERRAGQVDMLTVVLPHGDQAVEHATTHRLLRTQRIGGGEVEMWRIETARQIRGRDGSLLVELRAAALWSDLARAGLVTDRLGEMTLLSFGRAGYTPEEAMQLALSGYAGGVNFALGDVEPTARIELLEMDADTPLALMRRLEDLCNARLECEWDDVLARYVLHLRDADTPAAWGGAEVRLGKNLVSLAETRDDTTAATRWVGRGADCSMADAVWLVTSVWDQAGQGDALALNSVDESGGPVAGFAVLHGMRVRRYGDSGPGVLINYSAGNADSQTIIHTAAPHGLEPGDLAQLLTPDGDVAWYIDHAQAAIAHGVIIQTVDTDLPLVANLVRNPVFRDYPNPAGPPPHWDPTPGAHVSRAVESDLAPHGVAYGGSTVMVVAAAEGAGIRSAKFRWRKAERRPVLSYLATVIVFDGRVRLRLVEEGTGKVWPEGAVAEAWRGDDPDPRRSTIIVNDVHVPSGDYRLHIEAYDGAATFAVDGAIAAEAQSLDDGVVTSGGPSEIWRRTVAEALLAHEPLRTYEVELIQLHRLDPVLYADEALRVGDALRIYDAELGVAVEVRITALTERLDSQAVDGRIELSTTRRDITTLFRRPLAHRIAGVIERPRPAA